MKNIDTRYWIELGLIILLLVVAGWILFGRFVPGLYSPALPFMLITIVAMTVAGQVILSRLLDQKFSKFSSAFLIYKALKILVLMTFMIIYATLHRDKALGFLGGTFIMYLTFMIFESRSLNRHSRKQSER